MNELNLTPGEAKKVSSILNQNPKYSNEESAYSSLLQRPSSKSLLNNILPRPNTAAPSSSPCGHANAGQELCYLCHQRNRRNVPVYLHEEIKQKEKEETQLLMQYQQLKDMEKQLQDEEKQNGRCVERAKMDAFNLGISEALKESRKKRPKTADVGVSIYAHSKFF